MKIVPVTAAPSATPTSPPVPTSNQSAATARAIAAFNAAAPSQNPTGIANASAVAPEEMGAIHSGVQKPEEEEETLAAAVEGQKDSVEPSASEPASEEPKPTPEEEPQLSTQYAAMARKEKALRIKQAEFQRERDEFNRQKAIAAAPATPQFDESKYIARDRLKTDTLAVLAEEGVSYDELTQAILNQGQYQQDPQTKATIAKLEARLAKQEEALQKASESAAEQQTAQYKQAVNEIRENATQLVKSDPAFEIIKETGSVNDVVELIEETWKQDGILLSVEDAAREVEEYLEKEALKISRIKKLQDRMKPAAAPAKQQQATQPPKQPQTMKTLTNAVGVSRPLTAKERAIRAFKGEPLT